MIDIDPGSGPSRSESTPGTARPPRPAPAAPGTRYLARDARNAGAARPTPPAPIRTPDDRRSPVFDVTDKHAVDRLAAVVVMLERREREAREAHKAVMRRFYASERAQLAWTADNMDETGLERLTARSRWLEAQSALAAARELATDR